MVKNSRINPKYPTLVQSPSQETQETTDLGPSLATWGRKYQRQHREKEIEREMELERQLSIEDTKLLQNVKYSRIKDFRSQAGSHTSKK